MIMGFVESYDRTPAYMDQFMVGEKKRNSEAP